MEKQKALDYFQNLYLVAVADGRLAEQEKATLVKFAQKMGINAREASQIMLNIRLLDFAIPEDKEEQITQLTEIVRLMMADGHIHEKEFELCRRYAEKIGKSEVTLNKLIANVQAEKQG